MGWSPLQHVEAAPTSTPYDDPAEAIVGRPHTAGTDPTCRVCQAMRRRDDLDDETARR